MGERHMSHEANDAVSEQPAQRRPWDAPRIVTVVPVDHTEGGGFPTGVESGIYKVS